MTGLADSAFSIGTVGGYRAAREQRKVEDEQDQDRALTLARNQKTDQFVDQSRAQQEQQWSNSNRTADATAEGLALKNKQTRQRIEDEGALDFMYEINSGVDPKTAAVHHNARGVSRMDENTVQYDPNAKTVSFDMDTDGNGKVSHFQYNVPSTIDSLEQITGKSKGRYLNTPNGGAVFDTRTGKFAETNPKTSVGSTHAHVVKGALVDDTGHVLYRDHSGADGGDLPGLTKFNPQTYSQDVSRSLGELVGGKFNPATNQWDFGGAAKKMTALDRIAQRSAQQYVGARGKISAQMIASVVHENASNVSLVDPVTNQEFYSGDFDPDKIRASVKTQLESRTGAQQQANKADYGGSTVAGIPMPGLGQIKPSVLRQKQDEAVQSAIVDIATRSQTALDSEYQRLGQPNAPTGTFEGEPGYTPPADEETGETQNDSEEQEDPTTLPSDYQPAVEPGSRAAPAPAPARAAGGSAPWPADAPPAEKFKNVPRGIGLKNPDTGDVWQIGDDGQLHVKRNGARR